MHVLPLTGIKWFTLYIIFLDVIMISESPCSPAVYWVDSLKLYPIDQEQLQKGEELNARTLMAVTTIYKTQFPEVPPFQDTAYVLELEKLHPARDGCMYYHNHNGHWTLSQLSGGRVIHYDSLQAKFICSALGDQLAAPYGHIAEAYELIVDQKQVQVQRGSNDCGVFAIAFATSVLLGEEPSTLQYDQKELRGHLAHCLENTL